MENNKVPATFETFKLVTVDDLLQIEHGLAFIAEKTEVDEHDPGTTITKRKHYIKSDTCTYYAVCHASFDTRINNMPKPWQVFIKKTPYEVFAEVRGFTIKMASVSFSAYR